jgi:hypothetical protein
LKIRASIPESFRLFVPHEKSELSAEKAIQSTYLALSRKDIENSLSLQLVAASIRIFSTLQGNRWYYGNFQRAVYWIFVLQKSVVSGKGQVRRHAKEVWTFAHDEKAHETTVSYSRHYGSFEKCFET